MSLIYLSHSFANETGTSNFIWSTPSNFNSVRFAKKLSWLLIHHGLRGGPDNDFGEFLMSKSCFRVFASARQAHQERSISQRQPLLKSAAWSRELSQNRVRKFETYLSQILRQTCIAGYQRSSFKVTECGRLRFCNSTAIIRVPEKSLTKLVDGSTMAQPLWLEVSLGWSRGGLL